MSAPFEELDAEACLALLQEQSIGRLAISRPDAAPYVVPVNYTVLRRSIVFRTTPGTKLDLVVTEPVSFEVDAWDAPTETGWSVVVQGPAYEASDREMECERLTLESVAERQNSRWIRLIPDSITGRRIVRAPSDPQPPVLVPDPGLEAWHGGGTNRWVSPAPGAIPPWVRNLPFFPRLEGPIDSPPPGNEGAGGRTATAESSPTAGSSSR